MAARHLRFPIPTRTSWKPRSAKSSPASRVSSRTLLRQWEHQHQRVRAILRARPDVGRPIVDAFAKVLDLINTTFEGEF